MFTRSARIELGLGLSSRSWMQAIFVADAHRGDRKWFIMRADWKADRLFRAGILDTGESRYFSTQRHCLLRMGSRLMVIMLDGLRNSENCRSAVLIPARPQKKLQEIWVSETAFQSCSVTVCRIGKSKSQRRKKLGIALAWSLYCKLHHWMNFQNSVLRQSLSAV